MLEEPKFNLKIWNNLVSGRDLSKAVEYPVVSVHIGANSDWVRKNPRPAQFLKNYRTSNEITSKALAFIQEKKARTVKDAALNFLRSNEDLWASWVDDKAKERVRLALKSNLTKKEEWRLNIGSSINQFINFIVIKFGDSFKQASYPVLKLIIFTEFILSAIPWYLLSLLIFFIPFCMGKRKLGIVVIISLAFIQALGLWSLSMQTLALMIISTFVSTIIGLPFGVLCSRNDKFRTFLLPVLDAMQTMPSFVYLIPALMLFGLGKVPAVFATVIYAIVPTIRLTDLGIRNVDSSIIEAAKSFGATEKQLLFLFVFH